MSIPSAVQELLDAPLEGSQNLTLLARAVAEYYKEAPTGAGITFAFLPDKVDGGAFYVSVCRYRGQYGEGKEVVDSVIAKDPVRAVRELCCLWLRTIGYGMLPETTRLVIKE